MHMVLGRCWTFSTGVSDLIQLLGLARRLAGYEDGEVGVTVFDGKSHWIANAPSLTELGTKLPPQMCWMGDRPGYGPRPARSAKTGTLDYDIECWVSPRSKLWAEPSVGRSKRAIDWNAAFTHRSTATWVQRNHLNRMPNLCEFAVYLRKPPSSQLPNLICGKVDEWLRASPRTMRVAGGIDLVRNIAETGLVDLWGLAPVPEHFHELRSKFDDMHKVMFGPARMFSDVSRAEKQRTFESVKQLEVGSVNYLVAETRTTAGGFRKFLAPLPTIILDKREQELAVAKARGLG